MKRFRKWSPAAGTDARAVRAALARGKRTVEIPETLRPLFLAVLRAAEGVTVLVQPPGAQARPRYTLEALLARCDPDAEISVEDREWLEGSAVGEELL